MDGRGLQATIPNTLIRRRLCHLILPLEFVLFGSGPAISVPGLLAGRGTWQGAGYSQRVCRARPGAGRGCQGWCGGAARGRQGL